MPKAVEREIEHFMEGVVHRNPGEPEFQQAVREVVDSVMPFLCDHESYKKARVLERMTEPDRVIMFAVPWEDDQGELRINRAWRVQFNNSIGPYKGGMRFHPSVTLSVLKFLGFEQTFKNSLTGLPMGGGKGGSNFNPRGRSDREVMRFCQSLMIELHRHIGEDTDVPAGDIGVGAREISFLFGQYKRLCNRFTGILTGKGLAFGGSAVRKEATGYGAVYFAENVLGRIDDSVMGKTATVSGSGNVALYCIEKLIELGAKVVSASDSGGTVHDPNGIDAEKLEWLKDLKEVRRGRIEEYADHFGCEFRKETDPWGIPCDLAFPCATQNELDRSEAEQLAKNGARLVVEGANMPTTVDALAILREAGVIVAPAKAANAGGVAVSGLEQSQNAMRISWSHEEVDRRLQGITKDIHERCLKYGAKGDSIDYVDGANVAGFVKVAEAMVSYGVV